MIQTTITEPTLLTLGGRIRCVRCSAFSKRTKLQCMAPAVKGKSKCLAHGGRATGPRTKAGKQKCADAKTIHGQETRQGRIERRAAMKRLRALEDIGHALGFMTGARIPGKKPG